jgi:hypothetical protein
MSKQNKTKQNKKLVRVAVVAIVADVVVVCRGHNEIHNKTKQNKKFFLLLMTASASLCRCADKIRLSHSLYLKNKGIHTFKISVY